MWLTASEPVYGCAVERHAEALAAQEKEVAQREASLQNEQEQVRQQKTLLEEAAATIEKERLEARDMLKVTPILEATQTYHGYMCQCRQSQRPEDAHQSQQSCLHIDSVLSPLCMFTSLLKKSQCSFSEPCLDSFIPSYPAQHGLECKTVPFMRPCRLNCCTAVQHDVLEPRRQAVPACAFTPCSH